ncbi:MAG: Mur ligase family protein, partial [Candidatus Avelusimicrobium sp.]
KTPLKVPLVTTGRIKRLSAIYVFFLAVFCYVIVAVCAALDRLISVELISLFIYLPVCFLPLILPFIFTLSNAVSCAFENPRNARYVKRAAEKLRGAKAENGAPVIKIGITGSYGKTSVKNILAAVLSEKYRVVATRQSYNTPVGIAKTVFSKEFDGAEVFIAEMGAAKAGDIEELCDIVRPDYAVFTGVCRQHSKTFGTLEDIFAEKKKIVTYAAEKAVCGAELSEKFSDKFTAEERAKTVFVPRGAVENVACTPFETAFDLTLFFKDGTRQTRRVTTPILGRGAAENIAVAAYLALETGLSADEIFRGIQKAKPVPHRLNLIAENGVYVLDDGYNASEKSALQALELLSGFAGRKYAVTPGVVETGIEDEAVNRPLGARLAQLDGVFLHSGAVALKEGYLLAGGKQENLRLYNTAEEVRAMLSSLLQEGDAVLFLNDLPDVY